MVTADSPRPQPPVAPRRDVEHELHGDRRVDPYSWLRQSERPEALAYLTAERRYYESATEHLLPLAQELAEAMAARLPEEERSASHPRERYRYLTHVAPGSDYARLCRTPLAPVDDVSAATGDLEVLLDPAELIGGSAYVDLGLTLVSPDERWLAYSVDTTGEEIYALGFRDLESGQDAPDTIARTYYTGAWSADSSTFFYTVHDDLYRPCEVWRHRLGTAAADDVLVLTEPDQRYELQVRGCRSGDLIEIWAECRDTTEVWLVDAHRPEHSPRCVEPRRAGVQYRVEHTRTPSGDWLLVVTNDGATEFRLMRAPLDQPGRSHWVEVVPEETTERLYEVTAFAGHVVTSFRHDGRLMARAYRLGEDGALELPGLLVEPEGVEVGSLELAANELFTMSTVQVCQQSYAAPRVWYDVDLDTGERTVVARQDVPGYQPELYTSQVVHVPVVGAVGQTGRDVVPVTIVRRRDVPLDASAPCLIYAYGAYESCFEPEFDAALIALLDRGVVFAHAHVRGGGEGGRGWWLDGRMQHKQHTFSDLIAVADHLGGTLVDGSRMVTRGLSAGGLLQGAVFSQAPDRWAGVVAEVPFVDVVTSMLDASVPLTVNEWDEWGDPRRPEDYAWMRAYSPYDNLPAAGGRPDLMVTGALHDPRVMVSEPAKWVAALRASDPSWSPRCVFRVELGAGAHTGPSGRAGHLRYEAEVYAWVLDGLGLAN